MLTTIFFFFLMETINITKDGAIKQMAKNRSENKAIKTRVNNNMNFIGVNFLSSLNNKLRPIKAFKNAPL